MVDYVVGVLDEPGLGGGKCTVATPLRLLEVDGLGSARSRDRHGRREEVVPRRLTYGAMPVPLVREDIEEAVGTTTSARSFSRTTTMHSTPQHCLSR